MKKYAIGLLSILLLTGCQEARTIKVEKIDTGYELKEFVTVPNVPVSSSIGNCTGLDNSNICIVKRDDDWNPIGYEKYNVVTGEYEDLGVEEINRIKDSKYGNIQIQNDNFNVYVKSINDYDNQIKSDKYYIEKNNEYTLLCEETYPLNGDYANYYLYEHGNKVYLTYTNDDYLIINEVNEDGYTEIERKPLEQDKYTLTNYLYEDGFIMEYESDENILLKINDEEYKLSNLSKYIIFDEIILVSNYDSVGVTSQGEVQQTYVIDRNTKEEFTLDEMIDVSWWLRCGDFFYQLDFTNTGNLLLLTYEEDAIKLITTSINSNATDKFIYYPLGEYGMLIGDQDYTNETCELSILTLQ